MALRISTGLRDFLNSGGSFKQAFSGGRMEIYTGTQPTSADAAATGTPLMTITDASGAHTAETRATGSIELTGGASGSISAVAVNSFNILDTTVSYNTSLSQTASDLADALNRSALNLDFDAVAGGTTVTLTAKPGLGTRYNSATLASTVTTITKTDTNFSGGVAAANGLKWEDSDAGSMSKRTGQNWTGLVGANGTMGWFRLYGPNTDTGIEDTAGTTLRLDGSISTSGAQLNFTSTSVSSGATQTVGSFAVNINAA